MDTIGLSFKDMEALMISLKVELLKGQEETIQSSTMEFISQGCSEDEARFRAGVIGAISIDASAILGIMAANNGRILLDLKEAGILKP